VDRSDERIRLIEEAVLLIRGEWPAVACGLCERVNRETGLIITPRNALDQAIEETADEAIRVVEGLYGHDAARQVQRRATVDQFNPPSATHGARRRRARLRSSPRPGALAPAARS
jgi:hypothetical protein